MLQQGPHFDLPFPAAWKPFPACFETIIRQVLDTVRVLDAKRLLITFKGGAEVEQAIES